MSITCTVYHIKYPPLQNAPQTSTHSKNLKSSGQSTRARAKAVGGGLDRRRLVCWPLYSVAAAAVIAAGSSPSRNEGVPASTAAAAARAAAFQRWMNATGPCACAAGRIRDPLVHYDGAEFLLGGRRPWRKRGGRREKKKRSGRKRRTEAWRCR
jgi:hypothetical protein